MPDVPTEMKIDDWLPARWEQLTTRKAALDAELVEVQRELDLLARLKELMEQSCGEAPASARNVLSDSVAAGTPYGAPTAAVTLNGHHADHVSSGTIDVASGTARHIDLSEKDVDAL